MGPFETDFPISTTDFMDNVLSAAGRRPFGEAIKNSSGSGRPKHPVRREGGGIASPSTLLRLVNSFFRPRRGFLLHSNSLRQGGCCSVDYHHHHRPSHTLSLPPRDIHSISCWEQLEKGGDRETDEWSSAGLRAEYKTVQHPHRLLLHCNSSSSPNCGCVIRRGLKVERQRQRKTHR